MSSEVRALEPKVIWNHFEDLNQVPRPSKKEARVIRFIQDFGASLGFETHTDAVGNVLIRKPATAGMEDRKMVVLQSHLDMVHQKNSDTEFDFDNDPIESFIDGEWVTAKGTTLGADNGMGVAASMAILSSTDIEHPAIEALFTIDEETGMTGAFHLEKNWLQGDILLNMDSEDEGELYIGCAGGIDINVEGTYETTTDITGQAFEIEIKGLKGGHSGCDIHLQRGNANKILFRMLYASNKKVGIHLASVDGGSLRNAIPREGKCVLLVSESNQHDALNLLETLAVDIKTEIKDTDPNASIELKKVELPSEFMTKEASTLWINALNATFNGVYRMSKDIEGLVETSNNLSRVSLSGGKAIVQCLTRSSSDSLKIDLAHSIAGGFENTGATVSLDGAYPGWKPNPKSEILTVMKEVYNNLYGKVPEVLAIHAGLECGIIGESQPKLDMISFGPTIINPHSPDEAVNIETVQKFWNYLLETLKNIPKK